MADILPPAPIDAPFASYNWTDWYKKVRDAINNAQTVQWSAITGTPTTLAGYGITDAASITGTQTLQNKTINLSNNTLVSTVAQLNTALSDGDVATLSGTETLSNKTHTSVGGRAFAFTGTLNDGAGSAAGTLTNAPSVGNPTKWISINDNGTARYIPTWT